MTKSVLLRARVTPVLRYGTDIFGGAKLERTMSIEFQSSTFCALFAFNSIYHTIPFRTVHQIQVCGKSLFQVAGLDSLQIIHA